MDNQLVLQRTGSGFGRVLSFWRSTVGKKMVMGVTGLMMVGFVIAHMAGNLGVFRGAEKFNAYAAFAKNLGELLWIQRLVLLAAVILHITAATQLTALDRAARPVAYVKKQPQASTFASRTMRIGGVVLAFFILFHLLHFTLGVIQPVPFDETDVYTNVIGAFRIPWVVALYVVAMLALLPHLYHGCWSAMRTLGLSKPSPRPLERPIAQAIAFIVFLGFTSIPLAVYFGVIN